MRTVVSVTLNKRELQFSNAFSVTNYCNLVSSKSLLMKRVALINGVSRQFKYNKVLADKYKEAGYQVTEFESSKIHILSRHLRHTALPRAKEILDNHDVIHTQSGGFSPFVHYFFENNYKQPFIFETPVIKITTGTFLAGTNLAKSHKVKPNALLDKFLATFCFEPRWINDTHKVLHALKERKQGLLLASRGDVVSDIEDKEYLFNHVYEKGMHGRLFYENDFSVVTQFLDDFFERQKAR